MHWLIILISSPEAKMLILPRLMVIEFFFHFYLFLTEKDGRENFKRLPSIQMLF